MNTTSTQHEPRIGSLADLARFIAPDSPVDVVDVLVALYHSASAQHGDIATKNPYAYLVFTVWDGMDRHPTSAELREAVSAASKADPPAPAFRIDHIDVFRTWGGDPTLTGRTLLPFVNLDDVPLMYVEACDPRGAFCRGVMIFLRPPAGQDVWTGVHLPADEALTLAGAIHHAYLHHVDG